MRRLLVTSLAAGTVWLLRARLGRLLRAVDRRSGLFAPRGATLYARLAPRILRPLYDRIASDVADVANGRPVRIIDIGSGPGDLAIEMVRRLPEAAVIGVDLAPVMVGVARQKAHAMALDRRIRFEQADAGRLPIDDGAIDVVVSSFSLHHWDEPVAVFAELQRVLRPGGSALIYDFAAIMYSTSEITAILGAAGWSPVPTESVRFGSVPLALVRRIRLERSGPTP